MSVSPECQYLEQHGVLQTAERGNSLTQLVWPATVHPHALDGLDANQLRGGVVAAVLFEGEGHELSRGFEEVATLPGNDCDLRRHQRAVQAVT